MKEQFTINFKNNNSTITENYGLFGTIQYIGMHAGKVSELKTLYKQKFGETMLDKPLEITALAFLDYFQYYYNHWVDPHATIAEHLAGEFKTLFLDELIQEKGVISAAISSKQSQYNSYCSSNAELNSKIEELRAEERTLQEQFIEANNLLEIKKSELLQLSRSETELIESMNPSQRSFVLQNLLNHQDQEDIIDLVLGFDIDLHYHNPEGISLIETATEHNCEKILSLLGSSNNIIE